MAILIPHIPFDFHGSPGEQEVFEALAQLEDSVYVFHSLRWVGHTSRSAPQGEADFLIFDPTRGLLIIEVKSGNIWYQERTWYQQNRATGERCRIQDPEEQAARSKFELLNAIGGRLKVNEFCIVCHAVWFPSVPIEKEKLPMNYAPSMTLDATDLSRPIEAIRGVFDYWSSMIRPSVLKGGARQRILDLISPKLSFVPSLRDEYDNRERQLIRMTNEQARIMEFLDEQEKAVIAGTAGTGKTVLAVEKARRLAAAGREVLIVCYNAALKNWLRRNVIISGVRFESFHSLAASHVRGTELDFDGMASRFLEYLARVENPWHYDDVIIDEGQDFQDEWIEWLALRTLGHFYVFFDPNQTVSTDQPPKWVETAECRLVLRRNCRNTAPIHRTSSRLLGLTVKRHDGAVDGPKPIVWECKDPSNALACMKNLVMHRLRKGLRPDEGAVLTVGSLASSVLLGTGVMGGHPLRPELEEGGICFTTIRKFKGLEASVVFIIDLQLTDLADEEVQRLLYVGGSRAKQELHILMTDVTDAALAAAVTGIAGDRKVPKNRHGLSSLLDVHWYNSNEWEKKNAEIS